MEKSKQTQHSEEQYDDAQQEDPFEEGHREYLYLDEERINVVYLSEELYMKLPDGTFSKMNRVKV